MTDQPKSVLGAPRTEENDQRLRDSLEAIRAAERGDQPETITVSVEVLRRLHNAAARDAYQDGLDRRAPGGGMSDWPTFLARLREQAT